MGLFYTDKSNLDGDIDQGQTQQVQYKGDLSINMETFPRIFILVQYKVVS